MPQNPKTKSTRLEKLKMLAKIINGQCEHFFKSLYLILATSSHRMHIWPSGCTESWAFWGFTAATSWNSHMFGPIQSLPLTHMVCMLRRFASTWTSPFFTGLMILKLSSNPIGWFSFCFLVRGWLVWGGFFWRKCFNNTCSVSYWWLLHTYLPFVIHKTVSCEQATWSTNAGFK